MLYNSSPKMLNFLYLSLKKIDDNRIKEFVIDVFFNSSYHKKSIWFSEYFFKEKINSVRKCMNKIIEDGLYESIVNNYQIDKKHINRWNNVYYDYMFKNDRIDEISIFKDFKMKRTMLKKSFTLFLFLIFYNTKKTKFFDKEYTIYKEYMNTKIGEDCLKKFFGYYHSYRIFSLTDRHKFYNNEFFDKIMTDVYNIVGSRHLKPHIFTLLKEHFEKG